MTEVNLTREWKARMKQENGLLQLLNERKAWDTVRPSPPCFKPEAIERAAQYHSQAENSDPFAYRRMHLHLSMCLDLPSDVEKEAITRLNVRHAAIVANEAARAEVVRRFAASRAAA